MEVRQRASKGGQKGVQKGSKRGQKGVLFEHPPERQGPQIGTKTAYLGSKRGPQPWYQMTPFGGHFGLTFLDPFWAQIGPGVVRSRTLLKWGLQNSENKLVIWGTPQMTPFWTPFLDPPFEDLSRLPRQSPVFEALLGPKWPKRGSKKGSKRGHFGPKVNRRRGIWDPQILVYMEWLHVHEDLWSQGSQGVK